jgi:hypothetical protein
MDQRNRSRMKYIEISGSKTDFSPWRLGDQKWSEGDEGGGSTEEKHPREGTRLALENLGHWRRGLERESHRPDLVRDREIERRRQWFRGLNTPGPAPGRTLSGVIGYCLGLLDIVWLSRTLSVGTFYPQRRGILRFFLEILKFDRLHWD